MTSSQDPVNLYYDLDIVNTDFSEFGQIPQRLTFTEVRASSILSSPQDYFMSIVRFSLDTAGAMPVFIPQIDLKQQPNQFLPSPPFPPMTPNPNYSPDFPNLTIYYITLNYQDLTAVPPCPLQTITRPIIYVPHFTQAVSNPLQNPPTAPLTLESTTQNYYWVGSFAWWIRMINKTISDAWTALRGTITTNAPTYVIPADFQIANPPYMEWDESVNYATLVFPASLFDQTQFWNPYTSPPSGAETSPAKANMFFNTPLHILFSSFEYVFNNFTNLLNENYMIRVYSKNGTNYYPTPAVVPPAPSQNWNAYKMRQQFGTGATMCPISSIVFETSLMPIVPQMIGIPKIFSTATARGTQAITGGQNNNISNEITDIVEPLNRGDEYFPNLLYLPQAEYRLIDLQGNGAISSIQISVKWKDIFGIYHDFFLQNGCGASLKILFRQKAFNNISSSGV